jgi:hypothetical protein
MEDKDSMGLLTRAVDDIMPPRSNTTDDTKSLQQQQHQQESASQVRIRITNKVSGRFKDLIVDVKGDVNLYEAVYDNKTVKEAHIRKWGADLAKQVKSKEAEIQCVVKDEVSHTGSHKFSIEDLKRTSIKQLVELAAKTDRINLVLQCTPKPATDGDEHSETTLKQSLQQHHHDESSDPTTNKSGPLPTPPVASVDQTLFLEASSSSTLSFAGGDATNATNNTPFKSSVRIRPPPTPPM